MGWLFGGRRVTASAEDTARQQAWEAALARDALPGFVTDRLTAAAAGRAPWLATLSPAELRLVRSHGIRPLATVSGTCWYRFGWSWTEGHEAGWHVALDRIRMEAASCGANAVVDVRLRTIGTRIGASMDFTLIGTAVRIDRLPPSPNPTIATVPALEWVRLLEAGIVPTGLAVGAAYEWITDSWGWMGGMMGVSAPLDQLGRFWENVRREAHANLRLRAGTQGNGVLAHTHFGELLRQERDKQPTRYLGRHIVLGTVVEVERGARDVPAITPLVDMRDEGGVGSGRRVRGIDYGAGSEGEGPI